MPNRPTIPPDVLRLSVEDLEAQLRPVMGRAADLRAYADAAGLPDDVTFAEAGRLVAAAFVSAGDLAETLTVVDGLKLASVSLASMSVGSAVKLPPAGAAEHPLLGRWLPADLSEAMTLLLKAGALWTQAAPDAPEFGQIELLWNGGGAVGAVMRQTFTVNGTPFGAWLTFGSEERWPFTQAKLLQPSVVIGAGAAITLRERQPSAGVVVAFPSGDALSPGDQRHTMH